METKSLLFGLIGFFLGGLLVSAAATLEKPSVQQKHSDTTMSQMTQSLKDKKGDKYDKQFIADMITHHQGAIDMAASASENAKHQEIKDLAKDIVSAQAKEIQQMKQWQKDWGYESSRQMHH